MQITYLATRQDTRVTSYSLRNQYIPDAVDTQTPSGNSKYGDTLSKILSNTYSGNDVAFVAFKSLSVDPNPISGEDHLDTSTPKDVVDNIVALLMKLCEEFGVVDERFLAEKDVVR